MEPCWEINLLGGLRAHRADLRLTRFASRRAERLLAYLAYYAGRPSPREVLAEWLWPGEDWPVARRNLTKELSRLRQHLEPPGVPPASVLRANHFSIELQFGAITTDVAAFRQAIESAREAPDDPGRIGYLKKAVALYQGELLPGFYDEWIRDEQVQLRELHLRTLRELVALHEGRGEVGEAVSLALRWSQGEPYCEEAHYTVMRLYAAMNRPEAALQQYARLKESLLELGLEPAASSHDLCDQLREARYSGVEGRRRGAYPPEAFAATCDDVSPPVRPTAPLKLPALPADSGAGAVPLHSSQYLERSSDTECLAALAAGESVVLVRGPREVGKTSLLARGLQASRDRGCRVALVDVQLINPDYLASAELFLSNLGASVAEQLGIKAHPSQFWDPDVAPNLSFQKFMRYAISLGGDAPLVWALDEVDLLFQRPVSTDLFRMFRAWHNARALDPGGPWSRLTILMAYATEPRLLALDPNLSPWNVGTKVSLQDFTLEQVGELNRRYGMPLRSTPQEACFYEVAGGHPFLVRRGLLELARGRVQLDELRSRAAEDEWIFGEHLRRMAAPLAHSPQLAHQVREVLHGAPCRDPQSFDRLVAGGILTGSFSTGGQIRCGLYLQYLRRLLRSGAD